MLNLRFPLNLGTQKGLMKKLIYFCCLASFLAAGCQEDPVENTQPAPETRFAFIGMEGQTPNGISSLARYNITDQTFENNFYRKENLAPLGAGLQDMIYDAEANLFLFTLGGTAEVTIAEGDSLRLVDRIEGLNGLKNIHQVGPNKYYLSSWDLDGIQVVKGRRFNLSTIIQGEGTGPGPMVSDEDLTFVVNTGGFFEDSTVTIIRNTVDTIVADLLVGINPNSMVIDPDRYLWVLSSGRFNEQNPLQSGVGSFFRFQLDSLRQAIDSNQTIPLDTFFYFNDNQLRPRQLVLNPEGRELYYLSGDPVGDVIRMPLSANSVSEFPFITGSFYSLAYDAKQNELYGLEALGPDQDEDGNVRIFSPDGGLKNSFKIGVKPRTVAFK